jgi:cell division inhibitor SepF
MVYLGLQDDDELDYRSEYEYGDYGEHELAEPGLHDAADERRDLAGMRSVRAPDRGADAPLRAAAPSESLSPAPRPSVVRTSGPTTASRVHVVDPESFNDVQEVGDRLKANQPVILNLQGVARELRRRLVDFSSGLTYAVGGQMARVADQVYLLTPSNVEVSPEEKERLQARGLYRA